MSKVILSQSDLPFPDNKDSGNKVTKFRYRIVNSNRNLASDWSVINYAEQDTLKYEAQDGMPAGGTTGQIPAKDSDVDYDVGWYDVVDLIPPGTYAPSDPPGGGNYVSTVTDANKLLPTGGGDGQVLTKQSAADYDVDWDTIQSLPVGGSTGQVLAKTSGTDYAVGWVSAGADPQNGNLVIGISMFA